MELGVEVGGEVARPVIPPILLLCLLMGVTAAASIADALARHARARRLSGLGAGWRLRYTPVDRFQLTARVAAVFPTPGAADVVVRDVLYGQEGGGDGALRYLFTVEYTTGVLRTKRRRSAVGTVVEAARSGEDRGTGRGSKLEVSLAPAELGTVAQYEWLLRRYAGEGRDSTGGA
jgi:hypothetical protein